MKKIYKTFVLSILSIFSFGQSVTLEPGKSVFDNLSSGTEVNSSPSNPFKIYSEGHLTPIDFYNYSLLHGRIRTSYGGLQLFGKNYLSLHTSFDTNSGPKFYLNSEGNVSIADNATNGFYRFNVLANNENVAFFGNGNPLQNQATLSLNNKFFLRSNPNGISMTSDGSFLLQSESAGSLSFRNNGANRFIIDGETANVGIGVDNPAHRLSVVKIRNNLSSDTIASFRYLIGLPVTYKLKILLQDEGYLYSYRTSNNSGLGLKSNNSIQMDFENNLKMNSIFGTVIRVGSDQNVSINPSITGIGEDGLAQAKANLDVNNTIRSAELDFNEVNITERRHVFADKDGILRVEGSSNYFASYNFSAVQAQDYDDQLRKGSGYAWFNTTNVGATMYLPINLPDGVRITNVRMFLLDNSASNLSFTLNKNSHATNTFTNIASAQSSTNTVSVINITDNANETVDNQNNSYYVNISSSGNWTGNTLQFHSLVITYQYQ
ncbi:hypothetical protein [Lacihabitans soyangensis]|uniref:Uncharacterized protein n=1 Tax=Lacihabitans soyangensis TaxID=869394 RepID=A0AAE3H850_9BACT|nr:hypothetical protein [Lacihabitans soyangensis]MCP9766016.1 hypothetical protein [Lacihabitans soyangensis]